MNHLREQLHVPLGDSGVDIAIRAGRYADIAQCFIETQYGPKISEWAHEKADKDTHLWESVPRYLERKLDEETERQYDTEVVIDDDSYSQTVKRGKIVPAVKPTPGSSLDDYTLTNKGLLLKQSSSYQDDAHEWHFITGEITNKRAVAAVNALEEHFSLMDPSLLNPWAPNMLTERTMHPIEMDQMGMLDLEMVNEKATISLDSAIRLLNGMRVYFDEQSQLVDNLYVPIDADVHDDKHGWETKPEGRAFGWALKQSGIDEHLENAKTPVESSEGKKFTHDHDSADMKYWQLAHGIVMRNTLYVPIIASSSTEFITEEGKAPQPIHRELRADYDVRTFSTLRASALAAVKRDGCNSDQINSAVANFFDHLNTNYRIDAQKLLGMLMGGITITAMFAKRGSKLEQRADEYKALRDRMQEKLASAGVDKANSGIGIVRF